MFKNIGNRIKNFFDGGVFDSFSVLDFSKYNRNYSNADYLNLYDISLYINKAINKRAEKVGEIEFILKRGDKVIDNDKIIELLYKPNKVFNGRKFWSLWQKYKDIFGEAYILVEKNGFSLTGQIEAMHLLRSDKCKPFFSEETGELQKVEYNTAKGTKTYYGDEIIYSHNPNPTSPLRGESLIKTGVRQIETSTQIDEYHSKILENGGRVEGVFNFKTGSLSKQQLIDLKDKYQEEYGSASKAGLPMFLSGDAEYQKLGLNPSELSYLETKKVNLSDICILTGVPKALMGITSDETFANSEIAKRIFAEDTVKPLLKDLVDVLNANIIGEGYELDFVDPTPEDKEERRKDLETANNVNALTLNEKREALGFESIVGGDVIYAPMNIVPLSSESEEKKPEKAKSINHPLRSKSNRIIYHALQLKRLDRRQQLMLKPIKEYFNEQKERLIAKLESQKTFKKKDLLGEIFTRSIEIRLAKETVLPILQQLLRESAENAKEIAGSDWDFQETATITSWLDKKVDVFANQINETTFNKLKEEFSESFGNGEDRRTLIKRIEETYNGITKTRAEMIARTEVHGVTQYGTIQGYKQAGMPIKIYVWAPGIKGGVRDNHQAMDGEERPIETPFSNGLMFPGDSSGPASEVINCECFI